MSPQITNSRGDLDFAPHLTHGSLRPHESTGLCPNLYVPIGILIGSAVFRQLVVVYPIYRRTQRPHYVETSVSTLF